MTDDELRGIIGDIDTGEDGKPDLEGMFKRKERDRKPSRTVMATPAVIEAGKEHEKTARELADEVMPHMKAIKRILKDVIRRKNKFWSLIEMEMDLGAPMDLSYNDETGEVEIYDDEE